MLQDIQVTPKTVIVVSEPDAKPMFSQEFVGMMQDRAYETLRAYLERTDQDGAVKLLDDLIILSVPQPQSENMWVYNQSVGEAIGNVSHQVLAMGGKFRDMVEA